MKINNDDLKKIINTKYLDNSEWCISNVGLSNTTKDNSISFLDDEKFANQIIENKSITVVITDEKLKDFFQGTDKKLILAEDPRHEYYLLFNYFAKANKVNKENIIHKDLNTKEP